MDGLWDAFHDVHMGDCAEACADKYRISRAEQVRGWLGPSGMGQALRCQSRRSAASCWPSRCEAGRDEAAQGAKAVKGWTVRLCTGEQGGEVAWVQAKALGGIGCGSLCFQGCV